MRVEMKFVVALLFLNTAVTAVASIGIQLSLFCSYTVLIICPHFYLDISFTLDNAIIVVVPKPIERHVASQSVQLTCIAYGIPFPNVMWTRLPATNLVASEVPVPLANITNNMTFTVSNGGFVASTIDLCNVQLSNAGRYRCSASNSLSGSNSSYEFSLSITPQGIIYR